MDQLRFDIHHADGRREGTVVHAPRIVIGSGAHCDVRLAADQAALEHVSIEVRLEGTFAQSLAAAPAALIAGRPFAVVELREPTVQLEIGGTHVYITRVAPAAQGSRKWGPFAIAKLALIPVLAAGIVVVAWSDSAKTAAKPLEAPPIFGSAAASCPRADPGEARAAADERRAMADGARERSPFEPREALSAVASYEVAAACYRAAGSPDAAEDSAAAARRLRASTERDVRARRVRLERLLLTKDYELAAEDVAVLRALTENQDGAYQQWLAGLAKEIKNQSVENGK